MNSLKLYLSIITVIIFGCTTTETKLTPKDDRRFNDEREFLCEALCTYRNRGAINRMHLITRGKNIEHTWQGLNDKCLELQSVGRGKILSQLEESLLVSEVSMKEGSKDYGFRLAEVKRDCTAFSILLNGIQSEI